MTAYYNEIDPYAAQWLRRTSDSGSGLLRNGWTTPQAHDTSGRSKTQIAERDEKDATYWRKIGYYARSWSRMRATCSAPTPTKSYR